jgi:deoxyribodipyrimidine photo-lyase
MHKKTLFIFRRDLRLADNRGLLKALQESNTVIPCFIFDPRQVGDKNSYASANCIQFMTECLSDLDEELHKKDGRLYYFYGKAEEIVKILIEQEQIDAVYCNRDYTPFSINRDEAIKKICIQHDTAFIQTPDLLLHEPEEVLTGSNTPYSIFTAFYKKSLTFPVVEPINKIPDHFYQKPIKISQGKQIFKKVLSIINKNVWVHGGRSQGLKTLKSIKSLTDYQKTRDIPCLPTSFLSAHLKFGTISIRETYWHIADTLGKNHPLLRQLYWRDFFTHVAYHSPFIFGQAFHEKYNKLPWKNNKIDFKAWCEGKTGFPIVDAGMRQLNQTGWMHNRVRMIVASFLVKDLHIDWRWGEQYFAQQLVDYDPAVNNGNWQWCASTGCDAQPYFRIFNPWIQQKKFDPDCKYIKKWITELEHVDVKILHSWFNPKHAPLKNYPRPIVDHSIESAVAKKAYKGV